MATLEASGQSERELVIGGDTTAIAADLALTGANLLLCDFAADAAAFKDTIGDYSGLSVRRNVDPSLLNNGDIQALARKFSSELALFSNPIAGTGVLPYGFKPGSLLDFFRPQIQTNLIR